jgi:hypothetical protein
MSISNETPHYFCKIATTFSIDFNCTWTHMIKTLIIGKTCHMGILFVNEKTWHLVETIVANRAYMVE